MCGGERCGGVGEDYLVSYEVVEETRQSFRPKPSHNVFGSKVQNYAFQSDHLFNQGEN